MQEGETIVRGTTSVYRALAGSGLIGYGANTGFVDTLP